MGRLNNFVVISILLITLIGGAVLGAIAGAGAAVYITQRQLRQAVDTAVSQALPVSTVAQQLPPATQLPLPTAVPNNNNSETAIAPTTTANDVPTVVARVSPAVVTVINRMVTSARGSEAAGSGSGAIISPDGYVITNHHVIDGYSELEVVLYDGSTRPATLVGDDPLMDLALLKIDGNVPGYLTLGNSDALRQGETVIAIGSPLGEFKNSVTVGVVSALHRTLSADAPEDLIQTDAAINSGNSGGPLLNMQGEIVGINTLVYRDQGMSAVRIEGLGFAVPSNIARRVSEQIIATGEVQYPFLGITYGMINADIAIENDLNVQQGAYVTSVSDGYPAANAGIQAGDVIVAIDGIKLGQQASLRGVLLQYKPNDTVKVTVLRGIEELEFTVTLALRPRE
jgi:2-alkenal reductase